MSTEITGRTPSHPLAQRAAGSSERVYRGMLGALYEGRLVPGQRLVEPDLMEQFQAGRSTVREVLTRLCAAGVVSIVRHQGAAVRRLTRNEAGELLDVVQVLFGLAARGAARHIGRDESAAQLRGSYDAILVHTAGADFEGFAEVREAFYRTIVCLSGNRELARLFPAMQVHILRVQLRRFGRAADALQFEDYRAITQAILDGDPNRAEIEAQRHVRHTMESVAAVPDVAFRAERD
jgi:DNA-binding GntR family transcriptional regulator